jgi:predicted ribonuclease YlaK
VRFRDIDLVELTGLDDGPFQLLVPILVVDELDGLKRSKDKDTRSRAAHTLGVLDELFRDGLETARLRAADVEVQRATGVRRGEVTSRSSTTLRGMYGCRSTMTRSSIALRP